MAASPRRHRYAGVMLGAGSLSWDRLFILLVAALTVLGPERLPDAVRWATRTLRQVRDQVNRAADQAKTDFGPDLAEIRQPLATLAELRSDLRDFTTATTQHLFADAPASASAAAAATGGSTTDPAHPPIDPQAT